MLDLTSLGDDDSPASVGAMMKRAVTPVGPVAAVCIWPSFVVQAKSALAGTAVRIATVSNFPHGRPDIAGAVATTKQAVADGADEVDVVWPYDSWLNGNTGIAGDLVAACKEACGTAAHLKVILETGRLQTAGAIAGSSRDAIAAGADFIKTSTGKAPRLRHPGSRPYHAGRDPGQRKAGRPEALRRYPHDGTGPCLSAARGQHHGAGLGHAGDLSLRCQQPA